MPQSKASSDSFHEVVVDSLEWMAIAGRVVQFFNMEESGIEDYLLRKNTLSDWADIVAKAREIASEDITVTTSGSTGEPKACQHSWSNLADEALFFSGLIKQQSVQVNQVVALVPSHHIYGLLFSVLLPDILDVPVVRGFKAFQKLTSGSLQQGDLVIGFPEALTQANKLLSHIPSEVTFTTSSGPCPAETVNGLYALGASKVIEIYGSSETAGIGYRLSPNNPFQLFPRWKKDSASKLLDKKAKQPYELPDGLNWHSDETFTVSGRVDNAVSVKGTNVYLSRIEATIESHPGVEAAAVRKKKPDEGEGLKAYVVMKSGCDNLTETSLKQWLSEQLIDIEIPTHVSFGSAIPTNSMGKRRDWTL